MKYLLILSLLAFSAFADDRYHFRLEFTEDEVQEILADRSSKSMVEIKRVLQKSLDSYKKLGDELTRLNPEHYRSLNLEDEGKRHCIQKCSSICYTN